MNLFQRIDNLEEDRPVMFFLISTLLLGVVFSTIAIAGAVL